MINVSDPPADLGILEYQLDFRDPIRWCKYKHIYHLKKIYSITVFTT